MENTINKHKAEMDRVKKEMLHCGTPHRNDLYKYYQRLKREYKEALFYLKGDNNGDQSEN